jgi:hypothetical protein
MANVANYTVAEHGAVANWSMRHLIKRAALATGTCPASLQGVINGSRIAVDRFDKRIVRGSRKAESRGIANC